MNLIKKILITGVIALVFIACKKNSPTPDSYMSYKVDGVSKNFKAEADLVDGSLLIEAGPDKEDLTLFLEQNPGKGTYDFADTTYNASATYTINGDPYDSVGPDDGTLIINYYDGKNVSGTFEFRGEDNSKSYKTITEGKFVAKVTHDEFVYAQDTTAYGVNARQRLFSHMKFVKARLAK